MDAMIDGNDPNSTFQSPKVSDLDNAMKDLNGTRSPGDPILPIEQSVRGAGAFPPNTPDLNDINFDPDEDSFDPNAEDFEIPPNNHGVDQDEDSYQPPNFA